MFAPGRVFYRSFGDSAPRPFVTGDTLLTQRPIVARRVSLYSLRNHLTKQPMPFLGRHMARLAEFSGGSLCPKAGSQVGTRGIAAREGLTDVGCQNGIWSPTAPLIFSYIIHTFRGVVNRISKKRQKHQNKKEKPFRFFLFVHLSEARGLFFITRKYMIKSVLDRREIILHNPRYASRESGSA